MQHRAWASGLLALGICAPLLVTSPAVAAPKLAIELTHRNLYGRECSAADITELEAGKTIGEVRAKEEKEGKTPVCGVDPFTGSATTLDRGSGSNTFIVTVKNVASPGPGNEVKEGVPVTVSGHLPEGLLSAPARFGPLEDWTCAYSNGSTAFTCTRTHEGAPFHTKLEPGAAYPSVELKAVDVGTGVPSVAAGEATVTGGESAPASTSDPTSFATVPAGIHTFTQEACKEQLPENGVCALEEQAGGHPIALATEIVLNYVPGPSENKLIAAGSGDSDLGPKSLETQLPPGMIGNVQATEKCKISEFENIGKKNAHGEEEAGCPQGSAIGYLEVGYQQTVVNGEPHLFCEPLYALKACSSTTSRVYNLEPGPGHPAEFGFEAAGSGEPGTGVKFILYAKVRSDGDYGATVGDEAAGPNRGIKAVFCSYGEVEKVHFTPECGLPKEGQTPFLTNPTQCTETPVSKIEADLWDEPANFFSKAFEFPIPTGCASLNFNPGLEFAPSPSEGTTQADEPSGMTFTLKAPGAAPSCNHENPPVCPDAEPALKNLTVTFPEGVTVSPANADGLQVCSNAQFGLGTEFGPGVAHPTEPAREARCPEGSQIGTLEVFSPLLPTEPDGSAPIRGELYVAEPECGLCTEANASSGQLFRLFLQLHDRKAGVIVKVHGTASVNPATGRLTSTFDGQPQLPFEKLVLHMKGGPRAPLVTPQSCGPATTTSDLTPWSTPQTADKTPSFAFNVDSNGAGGACPAVWPFFSPPSPNALLAGSTYAGAGENSNFSLTLSREDRETNIKALTVHMPPGLTAKLAGVPLCEEPAANLGTCSDASKIGSATVLVGAGAHPYAEEGKVYLTGPYTSPFENIDKGYNSGPFGLSIVTPTQAGPFSLEGQTGRKEPSGRAVEVVRSAIEVNPETAAVTVASDPLPERLDGVPLRLRKIHVEITRENFERNPTNCTEQQLSASLVSTAGQRATVPARFEVGACGGLSFAPAFSVSTQGATSRQNGASLTVKVTQKPGESNIKQTLLQLPAALPSRLTTLQHACTEAQFAKEPSGCPAQSFVGTATAHTPLLSVPLTGPAILVSHGGAAFPDVVFMLAGDGIKINLVGHTNIKNGITYSRFESVPDQPITSFETTLPEGSHSALAANGNLCQKSLTMPTTLVAQDGAQVIQTTKVSVTGCPKGLTRAQKLKRALKACRRKDKHHRKARLACERKARNRFGAKAGKSSTSGHRATALTGALSHATGEVSNAITTTTASLSLSVPAAAHPPTTAQEGACPTNQAVIDESNENPTTHEPYSKGLPECRAYEMVSPLEKQGLPTFSGGLPVAPNGNAVEYRAEGDFAEPQGFDFEALGSENQYLARRSAGGWLTEASLPPAPSVENKPEIDHEIGLGSEASCGATHDGAFACMSRGENGQWSPLAGPYVRDHLSPGENEIFGAGFFQHHGPFKGSSEHLSTIVFQLAFANRAMQLLPNDTGRGEAGIYEINGLGGGKPKLSLVNLDNEGKELEEEGPENPAVMGTAYNTGGRHESAYHAISASGERIFFGATPAGGKPTVFARVRCTRDEPKHEHCFEGEGSARRACIEANPCEEGRETITISESECNKACTNEEAAPAFFQGASADGSRVFFTTEQELLPADKNTGNDLYEYNFEPKEGQPHLTLLSRESTPEEAADVQGVVRTSSDGSHVYFVATGVLATETTGLEHAEKLADNLYGVETETGKVKFVAQLPSEDTGLWDLSFQAFPENYAQTTPDGNYLAFSTHAHLVSNDTCKTTRESYRYEFEGGHLIWLSHGAPGFTSYCEQAHGVAEEGKPAVITAQPLETLGARASIDDYNRAISESGEDIIFTTHEALQAEDVNKAEDVYLWHCSTRPCTGEGEVHLISDGQNPEGIVSPGGLLGGGAPTISASGNDIFFLTKASLVSQDKDELYDVYDARKEGGFPRETPPPSCSGDGCQRPASLLPEFAAPASSIFTGGHNLSATTVVAAPKPAGAVKHVTKRHKPSKHNKRKRKRR
jgi:hypothetical protein